MAYWIKHQMPDSLTGLHWGVIIWKIKCIIKCQNYANAARDSVCQKDMGLWPNLLSLVLILECMPLGACVCRQLHACLCVHIWCWGCYLGHIHAVNMCTCRGLRKRQRRGTKRGGVNASSTQKSHALPYLQALEHMFCLLGTLVGLTLLCSYSTSC